MRELKLKARYYRLVGDPTGHVEEEVTVNLDRAAFLPVDIYGCGFTEADGVKGVTPEMVRGERMGTVGRIQDCIEAARSIDLPMVYINNSAPRIKTENSVFVNHLRKTISFDWENEMRENPVDPMEYHFGNGTYLDIAKHLGPRPDDYFIRKLYYSGFTDTRLDKLLKHLDVNTCIFVGYAADICLHCTMVDAMNANYNVIFMRDAVLTNSDLDPEAHVNIPLFHNGTERINLWHEMYAGRSATTPEFVRACKAVSG
jgi:nicotinamidase-related amidase